MPHGSESQIWASTGIHARQRNGPVDQLGGRRSQCFCVALLAPVHTALSLVHPEDSYLCELIKGKDNTPGPTSSLSRVDRMYFKGRPADWNHTGNSNNTMACLEFKRAKALDAQEFKNAIVTTSQAYQGRVDAADEDDDHYLLNEMNVSTILSQATNYAIKFNTTFVALFDYQTLILLVMTQVEKKKGYGGDVRILFQSLPPCPPAFASHRYRTHDP